MCEILLRVKSDPLTGDLQLDSKQPQPGDVLQVVADGFAWGAAELGGPTYDDPQLQWYKQDFSVLVDQSVDLSKVSKLQEVPLEKIIGKIIGAKTAIADAASLPYNIDTKVVDVAAQTVSGIAYTYDVKSYLTKPMSAHPRGNHNFWRVVKLPAVTVKQASNLLAAEPDVDARTPSPFLQFRMQYIDFVKVQTMFPVLYAHILDDLRATPFVTLPYTAGQINQVVSPRPAIPFTGAQSAAYVAAMKGG